MDPLILYKIAICSGILIYASLTDIKTRTVSNKVWLLLLAAGLPAMALEGAKYPEPVIFLMRLGISFGFILGLSYFLYYVIGRIAGPIGGADVKALIVLSLIFPQFSSISIYDITFPLLKSPVVSLFTFSVFGNAVLLNIAVPFFLVLLNLKHRGFKGFSSKPYYSLIGYKLPVDVLLREEKHVRLMEEINLKKGKITSKFIRSGQEINFNELKRLEKLGIDKVWVTPGIPFMIPLTIGFLTSVFIGDFMMLLVDIFI